MVGVFAVSCGCVAVAWALRGAEHVAEAATVCRRVFCLMKSRTAQTGDTCQQSVAGAQGRKEKRHVRSRGNGERIGVLRVSVSTCGGGAACSQQAAESCAVPGHVGLAGACVVAI